MASRAGGGDGARVVAVDVGGSGLRLDAGLGPAGIREARGVVIGPDGIDVRGLCDHARALLEASGVGVPDVPDVLVWSMRGLLMLTDPEAVLRETRRALGARRTLVVSDMVAAAVGAVGGLTPVAVVSGGSGAVALGTDFERVWTRVDGWGHVLGDRGSAAWIGLAGLRSAAADVDGLEGSRALRAAAEEAFGPPTGWPRKVMAAPDAPARLASFAPVVDALAADDAVAERICARAGAELARSLLLAARSLPDAALVATGGVLSSTTVAAALDARLAASGRGRRPAAGTALDGARLLGCVLLERDVVPVPGDYALLG